MSAILMSRQGYEPSIAVRTALPEDAAVIARIRVETWRAAYRGLMPASVLAELDPAEAGDGLRKAMVAGKDDIRVLVGLNDDVICGFSIWNAHSEEPERTGEIRALYVLPSRQGLGLGKLLFQRVADDMKATGLTGLAVFALEANRPAHGFYRQLGGVPLPYRRTFEIAGVSLPEIGYRVDLG